MTLIKSLLLGSAAGIVAVASAQAADLPTRKGPVAAEYVRVCSITVAGAPVVGFVLPGSDTCFKISGYVTGQIEGGNLKQQYAANYAGATSFSNSFGTVALKPGQQAIVPNSVSGRDSFGYTTRGVLSLDTVSNTAYGPLVGHLETEGDFGTGFNNTGTTLFISRAYVTWAGITAGRANSFFSFTGGGLLWNNFMSPDRKGYNWPDVLAYTASFGGGFSATVSIEDPQSPLSQGGGVNGAGYPTYLNAQGTNEGFLGTAALNGMRVPDIVGAISVTQPWGSAQISGVAHNVRGQSLVNPTSLDVWGYAVNGGVLFNIPGLPAGSVIGGTASYSRRATWYSGVPDAMWDGTANDNGQPMAYADAYSNLNGSWAIPTAWSVSGWASYQLTPQFQLGVEGAYGQVNWTNLTATSMVSNERAALIGGVAHWDPVKNLDFELELMYEKTTTAQPNGYVAGNGVTTTNVWQGNSDGFATRFEVTRNF